MSTKNDKTPDQSRADMEALIKATVDKVNEVLEKSGYNAMAKDEGDGEGQPDGLEGQAQGDMPPPAPGGDMGGDAGGEPAPGGEGGDMPPPAPGAEGDAGAGGDDMEAMMQHIGSMPDEEVHMLLELLQDEMLKRQGGAEGGEPGAEAAPPAAPAPGGAPLEMSMKKEFAGLAKSVQAVAKAVEALSQNQSKIANEVQSLKKSAPAKSPVATKPAATNRQVQVMNKSDGPVVEPLTKSQLETFVMNEMRKPSATRHPAINPTLVSKMTYVKTPEEIARFAGELRAQGVAVPNA